jgi:MFS family permease
MDPAKPAEVLYSERDAVVTASAETTLAPGLPARLFAPRTGMLRALRHPDYRLFWTGNFLSNIGTWMHHVALGWLVLEMTNSPFLLGLVGFAQFTPALLFSLPGGVIADRVNRRRWLLVTHSIMLLLALTLALMVSLEAITYYEILLLAFLLGTTSAINFPAYQAMVRDLSSREDLLNAIALNSMQFNSSRFIGPAVAGILVSTVGLGICFYVNSASFLAPLVALSLLSYRAQPHPASNSILAGLAEGFHYLRGHGRIFLLVSLVGMISLFGLPYLIFLPVFARDILEVGARGLGYLFSASGGGALLGAVVLASWRHDWRRGPLVLGGMLFFFGGVLLLALSRDFWLSLAALVVAGGAMVCVVATINSLLQTLVPDQMRGRVLGWHSMAYLGLSPIGSLLVGALADTWGTPAALAVSATVPLGATLLLLLVVPWLRHLH